MGDQPGYDIARDEWLKEKGLKVIRIAAKDVLANPLEVADQLVRYVEGVR